MASLIKRGGVYYARFRDVTKTPREKRVSLKTKKRREAEQRLKALEGRVYEGTYDPLAPPPPPRRPTRQQQYAKLRLLDESIEAYLHECRHLHQLTQDKYRSVLTQLQTFLDVPAFDVRGLTAEDIYDFLHAQDRRPKTRERYCKEIGFFLRWLQRQGVIVEDVSVEVRLERVAQTMPKAWRQEELDRLLEAIEAHEERHRDNWRVPSYTWLKRIIRLGPLTGLRLNEFIHMRWRWIDLTEGRAGIRIEEDAPTFRPKRGQVRVIPLEGRSLQTVRAWHEEDQPSSPDVYVFADRWGRRRTARNMQEKFERFALEAGLPGGLGFHGLRHRFAYDMLAQGMAPNVLKAVMGHSTLRVTDQYSQARGDDVRLQMRQALSGTTWTVAQPPSLARGRRVEAEASHL